MNNNLIKTGDILCVGHSNTFVSKAISRLTKSEYSHCCIFWWNYNELFVIESDGDKMFDRPGVVLTPFSEYLKSKRKLLILKPNFYVDGSDWGKFMLTKVGRIRYNYWNLIVAQPIYIISNKKLWVGTKSNNDQRMVCSSFAGYVINNFNPDIYKNWYEIQPKDIANDEINFKHFCEIV